MKNKKLIVITTAIWVVFSLLALSLGGCATMREIHTIAILSGRPQVRQCLMGFRAVPCQTSEIVGR